MSNTRLPLVCYQPLSPCVTSYVMYALSPRGEAYGHGRRPENCHISRAGRHHDAGTWHVPGHHLHSVCHRSYSIPYDCTCVLAS